jgi:predicted PurR-regulated permease PerM
VTDDSSSANAQRMPRWVWKAIALFWIGWLVAARVDTFLEKLYGLGTLLLISLFLSLAIEPGVNRLARRGWRRGSATMVILLAVVASVVVFAVAVGALVGEQIAILLGNSETYVNRTVDFLNDTFGTNIDASEVIEAIQDPDGPVQRFIQSQQERVLDLSVTALGLIVQMLSIMLFTFYLVADGPLLRRVICSRLPPHRQRAVLDTWELAIDKTGGYLYSRLLLAAISSLVAFFVLSVLGVPFAIPLALFLGFVSQFIPVIGTYIAAAVPLLVALLEDPWTALFFLIYVVVYQQIENYLLAPRITARTMALHPAVAFFAALAGGSISGLLGAFMALPAAAIIQATISTYMTRHEVVESELTREEVEQVAEVVSEEVAEGAERQGADDRPDGLLERLGDRLRRDDRDPKA